MKYRKSKSKYTAEEASIIVGKGCSIGDGWGDLVVELYQDLVKIYPDVEVNQVKEKFGGLRFYTGGMPEEGLARVRKAEQQSYRTCERCGRYGKSRGGSWITTLCTWDYLARNSERRNYLKNLEKQG